MNSLSSNLGDTSLSGTTTELTPFAFKEWSLICEALGSGMQSIILRRGGIAEGRGGFRFEHEEFFLFPTLFHEQQEKVTEVPQLQERSKAEGEVRIDFFAKMEWSRSLESFSLVEKLRAHHIWKAQVVQERFHYKQAGQINLAFLRVYRLLTPWLFPDSKAYGGCKSWVQLPGLQSLPIMELVLSDEEHSKRNQQVLGLLNTE